MESEQPITDQIVDTTIVNNEPLPDYRIYSSVTTGIVV